MSCAYYSIRVTRESRLPRRRLQLDCAQAQGVSDHGNGAEGHRRAGENRAEQQSEKRIENYGGDRNPDRVIEKRECEVLADVAHRRAAESAGARDALQVAREQRDSSALNGDVGS